MQSLILLARTAPPGGNGSDIASLVYSPYSSTAHGQALLMSSLDGHVSLFKIADTAVSTRIGQLQEHAVTCSPYAGWSCWRCACSLQACSTLQTRVHGS